MLPPAFLFPLGSFSCLPGPGPWQPPLKLICWIFLTPSLGSRLLGVRWRCGCCTLWYAWYVLMPPPLLQGTASSPSSTFILLFLFMFYVIGVRVPQVLVCKYSLKLWDLRGGHWVPVYLGCLGIWHQKDALLLVRKPRVWVLCICLCLTYFLPILSPKVKGRELVVILYHIRILHIVNLLTSH